MPGLKILLCSGYALAEIYTAPATSHNLAETAHYVVRKAKARHADLTCGAVLLGSPDGRRRGGGAFKPFDDLAFSDALQGLNKSEGRGTLGPGPM
eukprot:451631-Rhodomonas_salina.1